jgi:hypothetical protein
MRVRLEVAHTGGTAGLEDPELERVRQDNPAARSLLLLSAAAAGGGRTVRFSLSDSQQLVVDLEPCRI